MHTFAVIAVVVLLVLGWRWYVRHDRVVKAANNAVAAKLAFSRLDASARNAVAGRALAICHQLRGEPPDLERLGEPQQLLLMSLAMYELNIPPPLAYMTTWYVVRNPFLALPPNSRTLDMVARAVSRLEGVEITIDQRSPWAARMASQLRQD